MSLSDDFAIAFDVGTTTIAAALVERRTGTRVAAAGSLNPQREFGLDVVTRLNAALASAANAERLKRLLSEELERLADELLARCGVDPERLSLIAFAANPTMIHLLLGLSVRTLAFPPHRPLVTDRQSTTTAALGWRLSVPAFTFPLPGGYVGGDLVAFLYGWLETGQPESASPVRLFLDLGTNGELALQHGPRIFATSAAAGPAFEGGNIACGMSALPGAVKNATIEGDRLLIETIGDAPPAGICGSAVIDAVGELVRVGAIDATGRLKGRGEIASNLANRLGELAGENVFILHRHAGGTVYLSQRDIRQVQLAKGAMTAAIDILLAKAGLARERLDEVIVTGSFGVELRAESLKNIGMFSENMVKIASFSRDGALRGAERAILAPDGPAAVSSLARAIKVIPLSGTPAFEKTFIEHMNFPIR